jgi:hypothetical protein
MVSCERQLKWMEWAEVEELGGQFIKLKFGEAQHVRGAGGGAGGLPPVGGTTYNVRASACSAMPGRGGVAEPRGVLGAARRAG